MEKLDCPLEAILAHQLGPNFIAKLIDINFIGSGSVFNGERSSTMAGAFDVK